MAKAKPQSWMITEQDLQELEGLSTELRKRTNKSSEDGNIYMMGQYTRILALVSAEERRIRAYFDRMTLADMRKTHKELRREAREAQSAADGE